VAERNTKSESNPQAELADDGLDIPEFLKISAERRKQAWIEFDARRSSAPAPGRALTETELAYRRSIERDKAAKRASDEIRFRSMRAKAAQERAERQAIQKIIDSNSPHRVKRRGLGRSRRNGKGPGEEAPSPKAKTERQVLP
jgi:hypothetical protein